MKRSLCFLLLLLSILTTIPLRGQQSRHMDLIGRWGNGPCVAAFAGGGFVYMGNGVYLDIFIINGTSYTRISRYEFPGFVQDVKVVARKAYVAVKNFGLYILNVGDPQIPSLIGSCETQGTADRVDYYSGYAYIADGSSGLAIINTTTFQRVKQMPSPAPVRDVFVSGNWAYVAADTVGLVSVDVTNKSAPVIKDTLDTGGNTWSVFVRSDKAYVTDILTGLWSVDVTNMTGTNLLSRLNLVDIYVDASATNAYMADRDFGLRIYHLNLGVENGFLNTNDAGVSVILNEDYAYVANDEKGLSIINVATLPPTRVQRILSGGTAHDLLVKGNAVYVAGGKSGLWVLNRYSSSGQPLQVLKHIDTLSDCRKLALKSPYLFVAAGPGGMKIYNVADPVSPVYVSTIAVGNFAYDVDVFGDSAYVADGTMGVRVFDVTDPSAPQDRGAIAVGAAMTTGVEADPARNRVYASAGADGIEVIDVNTMSVVGTYNTSTDSYDADISSQENPMLAVADGQNGLLLLDVSDPTPTLDRQLDTPGLAYDIGLKNGTAFVADGEGTVRMIDLSGSPIQVGYYHTAGTSRGVDVRSDTLAVADGEAGVYLLKVHYTGTLVSLENSLEFDNVTVGYSRTRNVRLTNTGSSPVWVNDITSSTGLFDSDNDNFWVTPGDTAWLRITFTPVFQQTVQDTVEITSDAGNSPLKIAVHGTGVERTPLSAYSPDYYTYALYHMDALPGGTVIDDSYYGYLDGTAAGLPTLVEGRFGNALEFNENDVINIPLDSIFSLPDFQGFSVDTWINLNNQPGGRGVIFRLAQGAQIFFEFAVDDTLAGKRGLVARMMPTANDTINLASGTTFDLNIGVWMHAALTYDDALRLYLNGVLVDSAVAVMPEPTGLFTMTIGNASGGGHMFPGMIDEFRMSGIARKPWEFPRARPSLYTTNQTFYFGSVRVGSTASQSLSTTNYGYQTLVVSDINWEKPVYSVTETSFEIASLTNRVTPVRFTPAAVGMVRDTLIILSNDPDRSVLRIPMEGTGILGPYLYTTTERLNFGRVLIGETTDRLLVVSNTGDQPLSISNIAWTSGVFQAAPREATIAPRNQRTITVTFAPSISAVIRDTLVITSNDPTQNPFRIPMMGTGVDYRSKVPYVVDEYTIALYHFEGTSVTVAADENGFHDGTLAGGVVRTDAGYFGKSLSLDGVNDYLSIPSTADLVFDLETDSFTVECFFRTDTVSHALFYKDPSGGSQKPNFGLFIDEVGRFNLHGFGTGETPVNDGGWHHVAFVYEGGPRRGSLFLDGVLELRRTLSAGQLDTDGIGPLIFGGRGAGSETVTDFFEGYLDEVRISRIARQPWEFAFAETGMTVSIQSDPMVVGTAQMLHIRVPRDTTSKVVTLYYRQGGQSSYTSKEATPIDTVRYSVVIPASDVTIRGVEYYVQKRTSRDTVTVPVVDPVNLPITASARFSNAASGVTLQKKRYRMISVPVDLYRPKVYDVLHDDMGDYSPFDWRFFAWKDTGYVEFSDVLAPADTSLFKFNRGKAFWIIPKQAKTFDVDSGMTASTASAFRFNLKQQWNMIGSPFPFPVAWDDCSLASDSIGTLYAHDGTGYRLDWSVFEPWNGYWIYNYHIEYTSFTVPPRQTALNKGAIPRKGVLYNLTDEEWVWRISAETPDAKDLDNFAGIRQDARAGWDLRDRFEPPPIGDYVALYFDHGEWEDYPGAYAADIRNPGEPGYIWEFIVESVLSEESVSLTWNLYRSLPEGWVSYLIDKEDGVSINLAEKKQVEFVSEKQTPNSRRFRLLVGSRAFVENESDVPLQPVEFQLFQNYPNPFNPETTIAYSLPKNGHVLLTIYNVLGQKMRVLVDEKQSIGQYSVAWDGLNDEGFMASSGIYFCKLEFPGRVAVRKLILVR
ncbi:MAG: LamG-like jellyroll fold domain-containing protein [bacterium]